jgi:hypothetical protein
VDTLSYMIIIVRPRARGERDVVCHAYLGLDIDGPIP